MITLSSSTAGRRLPVLAFGLVAFLGGCGGGREETAAPTTSRQEIIFKQISDNEEAQRKAGKPRQK